jgi:GT2 family glycosyltransferase/2-polyprenyl-3-methyl-5-hydroxy-6-metoxy-1,4-benzoquinol methylase
MTDTLPRALVCLLWARYHDAVERYIDKHPGTAILTFSWFVDEAFAARAKAYKERGCEFVLMDQLLTAEESRQIRIESDKLIAQATSAMQGADWRQSTMAGIAGPSENVARLIGERLSAELPTEVCAVHALDRAAKNYDVRLVVVSEDVMSVAKTTVLWARRHGVASLHLAHSVPLLGQYTVHSRLEADVLAVYGERAMEAARDSGIEDARCRITGNPAWDAYRQLIGQRTQIRKELCARYRLDADQPLALFATTWSAGLTSGDERDCYARTMRDFLVAVRELRRRGKPVQAVVKDRPANRQMEATVFQKLLAEVGLEPNVAVYSVDPPERWVVAADVLVALESNILIEAMLAGVPAINHTTDTAQKYGPGFDARSGVVEVFTCEELSAALESTLFDGPFRARRIGLMQHAAPRYNHGQDGMAAVRVAELMTELADRGGTRQKYPWQSLLNVDAADVSQYHNWAQTRLFELFGHPPRRLLDIGCGTGATGAAVKQAYPGAKVWGIEVNRAAAAVAAKRIDHALAGKFEDVDLDAAGITPGSLDTVIVADVLEHMYDPWGVLVRLKPYLTPDAQIIASIPNIRNLVVMEELAKGNWRYEEWGLLDITHIRFFTLREVRRFFHETGYRVSLTRFQIDPRLADFYNRNQGQKLINVEFDRMTLKNVTEEELSELCALQVCVRAEPGQIADADFKARQAEEPASDYALWRAAHNLKPVEGDLWEKRLTEWPTQPRIHLVIAATGEGVGRIGATLNAATQQLYHNVVITVAADVEPPSDWRDSEKLFWAPATGNIVDSINTAVRAQFADWIGVVDAGDGLTQHALLFALEAAHSHPEWQLIYGDEDTVTDSGEHLRPHFKPDFNPDLLRSYPYIGGLLLVKRPLFDTLGGLDPAMLGCEDFDLVLRASERVGPAGIGHVAEVLLHRAENGGHALRPLAELFEAGRMAVANHLDRLGIQARVESGMLPSSQRVIYEHTVVAQVSIVVAVRQDLGRLQRCLESILGNTRYGNIELLVLDAHSSDPEVRNYVQGLESLGDARIKAFRLEQDASLASLHNLIAAQASGDYLLFLHADASALQDDWLDVLMSHARRAEIGAVAPRLLNGDGTVRRGPMVLGLGGIAGTAFAGAKLDDPGYFGRALLEQNVSAVGAGALLTRRADFVELGGFDGGLAPDAAAIDYCLRLFGRGLRIVWTPHASLLCEGADAKADWGAATTEDDELLTRWLSRLGRDPFYNPNCRLLPGDAFAVDARATLNWDALPWKPLPRILAAPADNMGCGQYRILAPMRALTAAGKVQGWGDFNRYDPIEIDRLGLDSLVLQRQITDEQIAAVERHRRFSKAIRIFELDDLLLRLPERSIHLAQLPKDIGERLQRVVPMCDRFIVSTEPLVSAYRGLNRDIRVVPNMLERSRWQDLRPRRRQSAKARVGWIGGIGHSGDLEMIVDVVRETAGEVDWVFMGMCPETLRPLIREYHDGVAFDFYPKKMAGLNLDLAIAPLESNPFNEAKSNLRILEYGVLGYPVICSDIFPYQGDFPVTRVRNRSADWVKAIREHVNDLDECARRGDALREHIDKHWMLEDHLDMWLKAWLP